MKIGCYNQLEITDHLINGKNKYYLHMDLNGIKKASAKRLLEDYF